MFLNLILPGAKTWKPYWVEIHDNFLDISVEYGKEAFTSYHIGVLKVRPSKDFPDRPDVLEFYDGDGLTQVHFYVFTYDPFDILEFFKGICASYKNWRETIQRENQPQQFTCEVKPPGFFSANVDWKVSQDRISIVKSGREESSIFLKDLQSITPSASSSKPNAFKFSLKNGGDKDEHRCLTLDNMKRLLDAIYTNTFIIKSASEGAAAPSE
ncbi:hypothetical protein TVAG_494470 [Trichomonas vaginalis G3]|uniref:Uncharacterized protein n=1 Tax=Trichomonas vaginalis (strain ATCC PRA-98 / G3) TaxID=412133 RepID=A2DQ78_TRIV3|nr:hypothetical protein TVAGG3_0385630 [Trichomonas vaginalis G3]EAY17505.1 hypothetical protein TVAG_494470 [Trichomonas vaginalis G3]KAI5533610.1 hypothetical protein TVAGG3_0385630 [Trichomonas vaginalis G3]|eukprot:XP_001329640.1 hypothetical protein [Trichomonas vaginalis G3]